MALGALLGASALAALLRTAGGLGVARVAQPRDLGGGATQGTKSAPRLEVASALLRDDELIAGRREADEEGDFGLDGDARRLQADEMVFAPSEEEIATRRLAAEQCNLTGQPSLENGVIAYLVTREADLEWLTQSLPRLRYHFLRTWPYPVKIFIPSDGLRAYDPDSFSTSPDRKHVSKLARESLGGDYDWEVTTFDVRFPDVIERNPAWKAEMNTCARAVSTSYKHMNQFFTKALYEHESLQKYRYYLRMDADFAFQMSLRMDPFCVMAQTGRKFVWQTRRHVRDLSCSDGLWEWFLKYQQDSGLIPQDTYLWKESSASINYVGYVGMGDLDFFRSERVRKLAGALNEDGRVYLNRWSDQTYYVLLLALFENHTAVGDLGFGWSEDSFCHKSKKPGRFDPFTGKVHFDGVGVPSSSHGHKPRAVDGVRRR
jgi:hypothetical protein